MPSSDWSRRDVLKAAVATGSTAALAACLDLEPDKRPLRGSPASKPARQHAWNDHVRADNHGNVELPRHQTLLYLSLDRDGQPTESDRETVERALAVLDEAYEWSSDGLLFSVAYSPAYFERFDSALSGVDLPQPEPLSPFEDPVFDTQDVLVHLASDRADVVLEAEHALTGGNDEANGVGVDAALIDVLSVDSRRTGFVGAGMPAEHQDAAGIPGSKPVPEKSPLFMGFTAGFRENQATEDYVTIQSGPFAGGTTKVVSNLRQRLDDWYGEQNYDERVMELFSPGHAADGFVEGVGNNLGANSRVDDYVDDVEDHAHEHGRVGHAQKAARANRDSDGNVRVLRRHFESTDDIGSDRAVASLHFPSLQREISTFEDVRRAMNGTDVTEVTPAVRQRVNNGLLEYIFVRRRGYFLVPPRALRALPEPSP
ncbi:twin-arginine translocation signal domain-containing protein [Halobacterium noricense]|uniref:twin-arginine translocation signal domain-containing protein n=1 Tax=Halobacterium noricense TaxID=223182 RepID=UPI001E495826|nr:twin-arginine translocation signal domain-containing protein [Halobacterium noricense]UHH26347.1 twin-arginine translocation signal domain-containing protein [Halobacterium noricense]